MLTATCVVVSLLAAPADEPAWALTWPLRDPAVARGRVAPLAVGRGMQFDGRTAFIRVPAERLPSLAAGFSVAAWACPFAPGRGQQVIVAKNVYSAGQREWGLLLDRDARFRLYLRRGDRWETVTAEQPVVAGRWSHLAAIVAGDRAELYVNGRLAGRLAGVPVPVATAAPLTVGAVDNAGHLTQPWWGAIDAVRLWSRALAAEEISAMSTPVPPDLPVPEPPHVDRFPLWDGDAPPAETEVPVVPGVRYLSIQERRPEADGYDWLHGVALGFHGDRLWTSWGANQGLENTPTEVTRGRWSSDLGATWSPPETLGPGGEGEANSHGVFLSHQGELWAFLARFGKGAGRFAGLAMEAVRLDGGRWVSHGLVARGIWPLQEPLRLADGRWLVPGCDEQWRAAVAVSAPGDLLHWETVRIPVGEAVHTEAAAWAVGDALTLVMRNESAIDPGFCGAAVSVSRDGGRTWSTSVESNFPIATSKPYCGVLSTGQRYLVANVCRAEPRSRRTMAIAVSRPGEAKLCRLWRLETATGSLAYPYAVERDGLLYVGYSWAPPGLGGNRNSLKLAVLPVASLAVE